MLTFRAPTRSLKAPPRGFSPVGIAQLQYCTSATPSLGSVHQYVSLHYPTVCVAFALSLVLLEGLSLFSCPIFSACAFFFVVYLLLHICNCTCLFLCHYTWSQVLPLPHTRCTHRTRTHTHTCHRFYLFIIPPYLFSLLSFPL
jgi:hypothetical protein